MAVKQHAHAFRAAMVDKTAPKRVSDEVRVLLESLLLLVERPFAEWTVDKANHIMHYDRENIAAAACQAAILLLSSNWRDSLLRRVQFTDEPDDRRLNGTINLT